MVLEKNLFNFRGPTEEVFFGTILDARNLLEEHFAVFTDFEVIHDVFMFVVIY